MKQPTNKDVSEKALELANWIKSKLPSNEMAHLLSYEGEEFVSPSHVLTLASAFLILSCEVFDTLPSNVSREVRDETFMELCLEIRKVFFGEK